MAEGTPPTDNGSARRTRLYWRSGRIAGVGPFIVAFSGSGPGRMGYQQRWSFLAPISTRLKIVYRRCDWCGYRLGRALVCPRCGE